ncbi:MAG TPA: thioredoxin-disulfide reductase [Pyrodictium sp.]|nr:thioredoxin-disulfide reductase [Pyrodictium sp.]
MLKLMRIKLPSKRVARDIAGKVYDVVVVGGGPAGLTAALYAARYMLSVVVITERIGGQMAEAGWIENYPGIPRIVGPELAKRFEEHVKRYNVPIILDTVVDVLRDGELFVVKLTSGVELKGRTIILAMGVRKRRLGVPGELEFLGRGVSYCAPCDAPLFRGKRVAVVGGGDSAASAALLLAEYADKVYIVHRRDQLRVQPLYRKLLDENPRIEVLYNRVVKRICGDKVVRKLVLENTVNGQIEELNVDGVFIEIGAEPPTDFAKKLGLEVDDKGYIKVRDDMSTNIPGVFAAGDCTNAFGGVKQIIVAAAMGAIAATSAYKYLLGKKEGGRGMQQLDYGK